MKLLIVSPFFPPFSSVAVVRIASLSRFLIKKGYEITVLTNKISNQENQLNIDENLQKINKVEVDLSSGKGRFFTNKELYIESFHELMKKEKFDCVLITAGPYYTLPLCKISKEIYSTKCILDFRDLWIFDIRSVRQFLSPISLVKKFIFFPIERQAIKYADKVFTVTDGWRDILKKIYPKYKEKIKVVYNGFDETYINDKLNEKKGLLLGNLGSDNFKIVSFGKLSYYSSKYSRILFQALNDIESNSSISVIQVGNEEPETEQVILETGYNVNHYINTGFTDYRDGMSITSFANICLIIDVRKKAIGTKVYDYIYLNKPILYIGKKNTYLSKFVSSFENGFSCHTKEEVIKAIQLIIDENRSYLTSDDSYKKYSREIQNKHFLRYIEGVIQGE